MAASPMTAPTAGEAKGRIGELRPFQRVGPALPYFVAEAVFRLVLAKVPGCAGDVAEGADFRFLSHRASPWGHLYSGLI